MPAALSRDNKVLATGLVDIPGDEGEVWLWEVATGKLLEKEHVGGPVYSLSFSPDGKTVEVKCRPERPMRGIPPPPATLALGGIGGLLALGYGWRNRKRAAARPANESPRGRPGARGRRAGEGLAWRRGLRPSSWP